LDELAAFQLIELHFGQAASQDQIVGYRIGEAASGGVGANSQPADPSLSPVRVDAVEKVLVDIGES
jgi:hypothetical protein